MKLTQFPYTKLVCTIGPSSSSAEMIEKFISAGMNMARLNFSHGDHKVHAQNIAWLREISKRKNVPLAILQDLQGPKIRTGKLFNDAILLEFGQTVILHYAKEQTELNRIPIDFEHLASDVSIGQIILLDDGLLEMVVIDIQLSEVICEVKHGGILKSRKGVNFPQCELSIPATTEKDIKDLHFGLAQGVDYIALSFVQSPEDVQELRAKIRALGHNTPIISKVEMLSAVQQIEEVCAVSDGIMVARGDLGVECGFAHVASFQKQIIKTAVQMGKPVIVATQMLDSMITNRRPTKAEICDVSSAVFAHADATMLSGESASGQYPLSAVQTMRDIVSRVDKSGALEPINILPLKDEKTPEVFARTAVELAHKVQASAIISLVQTGHMAQLLAKYRPNAPILAFSASIEIVNRLSLLRGVWGMMNSRFMDADSAFEELIQFLKQEGFVEDGDMILIAGGIPMKDMKSTNTLKVHRV